MGIIDQVKILIQQKSDEYQASDPGQYDFWNGDLKYAYHEAMNWRNGMEQIWKSCNLGHCYMTSLCLRKWARKPTITRMVKCWLRSKGSSRGWIAWIKATM